MSATSPTQRTRAYLKARGITNQIVEHWVRIPNHPAGGKRRDLFGCIDIVALIGQSIVGIQTSSGSNHAARRAKIEATPEMHAWFHSGGGVQIWSWSKRGATGKRKLWQVRRERWSPDEDGSVWEEVT